MDKKKSNQQKSVTKQIECSNCNNKFSTFLMDMKEYAYKFQYRGEILYFCSWSCMRKWQRDKGIVDCEGNVKYLRTR